MASLRDITILSGGQTGADRAALEFAIRHGIPHGGWCPRGRSAEDGVIPSKYDLQETPSRRYSQRTEWNVRDSDATVVFSIRPHAVGGTALTLSIAGRLGKPCLHLSQETDSVEGSRSSRSAGGDTPHVDDAAARLLEFLDAHHVRRLNVAGPRASQEPGIGVFVEHVLQAALEADSRASRS